MKAHEIIRNVLDLIDQVESGEDIVPSQSDVLSVEPSDDVNRFKQIIDLVNDTAEYSNCPDPAYSNVDSVTINAGGGLNGPKNPSDIRVKDPSAYPNYSSQEVNEPPSSKNYAHLVMIKGMRDL